MSSAICSNLGQSKILVSGNGLNLYHTNLTFNDPVERSLLKTLWEKEKMLVTGIFSFSHNVFLPFPKQISFFQSHLFCRLQINAFNLDQSKMLSFGKESIDICNEQISHPCLFYRPWRVPPGSVVKCLTRNLGVLGSSRTGSSGFFRGSVLGQDTSEPSLVLVKPRKA